MLYELNNNNRITVRSSIGDSEKREISEAVTLGSISASLVSSSNLSSGVTDFFEESEDEIHYGSLKMLPQSFQDDLMRVCRSPQSAQFGNDRFQTMADTKLLSYNLQKTYVAVL